jgi:putative ABC transport system permease protein
VLRQAAVLVAIGLLLGGGSALAAGTFIASLLHGVTPTDPVNFAAIAGELTVAALLAAWIPASRASRVDPIIALRSE